MVDMTRRMISTRVPMSGILLSSSIENYYRLIKPGFLSLNSVKTQFIINSSSRENSPEVRRRTFPANHRNQSYLSPSPLASPYGSRSNSPARHGHMNNQQSSSPGFLRRVTTGGNGPNQGDKWNIR